MSIRGRLSRLEKTADARLSPVRVLADRAIRGDHDALCQIDRINAALSEQAGEPVDHPDICRAMCEAPPEVLVAFAIRHGLEEALPPGDKYLIPQLRGGVQRCTAPRPAGWSPPGGWTEKHLVQQAIKVDAVHLLPPDLQARAGRLQPEMPGMPIDPAHSTGSPMIPHA